MDIKFIYPDISADEFIEAVDDLNRDVDICNSMSFLPRLISLAFGSISYVITALLIWLSWHVMVFLITGQERATIIAGLIIMALFVPSAFSLQKRFAPVFKAWLLDLLKLKDYEEKFTLREYIDRDDSGKKLNEKLKFYRLCDELKDHKISDATITYDGSECEVDISYADIRTGSDVVRRIKLPLRVVHTGRNVVVDFERECVVYPEQFI